jgi:hypothetical protein
LWSRISDAGRQPARCAVSHREELSQGNPTLERKIRETDEFGDQSMTEPQRTDYLPAEVYQRHINEALKRGDRTFADPHILLVPWNSNFDRFVANVAFELRHYVIYRSDGGKYARGLVRNSDHIADIFKELRKSQPADGTKIRIQATFWRRRDAKAANRWAMIVSFLPLGIIRMEGEAIDASPAITTQSEKQFVETLLHEADLVAQNISRQNSNQGERVSGMVKIAADLGYPQCLELWYYGPAHVEVYLDVHTNNEFRRKMTAKTGGQFPFDGWPMQGEGQNWDSHEWRAFPFRAILKLCRRQDPDQRHAWINNVLLTAEEAIFLSIKKANFRYQTIGDARALGPLAVRFYDHFQGLQTSNQNLLSAFAQIRRLNGMAGYFLPQSE